MNPCATIVAYLCRRTRELVLPRSIGLFHLDDEDQPVLRGVVQVCLVTAVQTEGVGMLNTVGGWIQLVQLEKRSISVFSFLQKRGGNFCYQRV